MAEHKELVQDLAKTANEMLKHLESLTPNSNGFCQGSFLLQNYFGLNSLHSAVWGSVRIHRATHTAQNLREVRKQVSTLFAELLNHQFQDLYERVLYGQNDATEQEKVELNTVLRCKFKSGCYEKAIQRLFRSSDASGMTGSAWASKFWISWFRPIVGVESDMKGCNQAITDIKDSIWNTAIRPSSLVFEIGLRHGLELVTLPRPECTALAVPAKPVSWIGDTGGSPGGGVEVQEAYKEGVRLAKTAIAAKAAIILAAVPGIWGNVGTGLASAAYSLARQEQVRANCARAGQVALSIQCIARMGDDSAQFIRSPQGIRTLRYAMMPCKGDYKGNFRPEMHKAIIEEVTHSGLPTTTKESTAFHKRVLPQTGSDAGKFVTQYPGVNGYALVAELTPRVPLKRQEKAKAAAS